MSTFALHAGDVSPFRALFGLECGAGDNDGGDGDVLGYRVPGEVSRCYDAVGKGRFLGVQDEALLASVMS